MASDVNTISFGAIKVTAEQTRAAAVHIADRIAAQHPEKTAAELAANPDTRAELDDVLAALGIRTALISKEPVT